MSDAKEENPALVFKNLKYFNEQAKVKLTSDGPIKTGEGKYGAWYLWFGEVENATVYFGKGSNLKEQKNYTGKVIFFPSDKLNENLIKAADGKINVTVGITKVVEEGKRGPITKYVVEKLSDGELPQRQLTPGEIKLLNDFQDLQGVAFSETDFIKASQESQYGGNINLVRAKELYKYLKR